MTFLGTAGEADEQAGVLIRDAFPRVQPGSPLRSLLTTLRGADWIGPHGFELLRQSCRLRCVESQSHIPSHLAVLRRIVK